jgi:hypothetical protein
LPKSTNTDVGLNLEQKLMSWCMQFRRKYHKKCLCLRLGDTPFLGISGARHKIDNVIYFSERNEGNGYIVECKNIDTSRFVESLNQGLVPHVERRSITALLFKAYDICPRLFFKRHFYFDTKKNFCMLVTTKPLDSTSLSLALSYGICVVQPQRNAYYSFFSKLDSTITAHIDLLQQVPLYFPPEVIWKGLSEIKKASKANVALAYSVCRQVLFKSLESIAEKFPTCRENFQKSLHENQDIVKKISYLSMYFNSLTSKSMRSTAYEV